MGLLAGMADPHPLGASLDNPCDASGDTKVRDAVGAMRPDTETTTSSSHARGTPQEKGTQVEVYDLEGLTVEGLKGLCDRFGLRRSGLCGELIVRIMAELRDGEARCA